MKPAGQRTTSPVATRIRPPLRLVETCPLEEIEAVAVLAPPPVGPPAAPPVLPPPLLPVPPPPLGALTLIGCWVVPVFPLLSVTVSTTSKPPARVYVCAIVGWVVFCVTPSPNAQW